MITITQLIISLIPSGSLAGCLRPPPTGIRSCGVSPQHGCGRRPRACMPKSPPKSKEGVCLSVPNLSVLTLCTRGGLAKTYVWTCPACSGDHCPSTPLYLRSRRNKLRALGLALPIPSVLVIIPMQSGTANHLFRSSAVSREEAAPKSALFRQHKVFDLGSRDPR